MTYHNRGNKGRHGNRQLEPTSHMVKGKQLSAAPISKCATQYVSYNSERSSPAHACKPKPKPCLVSCAGFCGTYPDPNLSHQAYTPKHVLMPNRQINHHCDSAFWPGAARFKLQPKAVGNQLRRAMTVALMKKSSSSTDNTRCAGAKVSSCHASAWGIHCKTGRRRHSCMEYFNSPCAMQAPRGFNPLNTLPIEYQVHTNG